jgi:predicted N-acetyltransferase YhbS
MIRQYRDSDYEQVKELYRHSEWFGGQFDKARDSREKLAKITQKDPEAIFVCEEDGEITGSISLIEDGRVAWLFRFVVKGDDQKRAKELYDKAIEVFKKRGHSQILVYSPLNDTALDNRYKELGMNKGNNFTAYWKDI